MAIPSGPHAASRRTRAASPTTIQAAEKPKGKAKPSKPAKPVAKRNKRAA